MSCISASKAGKIRRHLRIFGALLVLLIGGGRTGRAQTAADHEVQIRPHFDITTLYRNSAGFGLGGGVDVLNLQRPGSQLSVDAYVAQHAGEYEIAFFPHSLLRQGVAGGVSATYETHGRRPFYGIGPATTKNNRLRVETELISVAGHMGYRKGQGGLVSTLRYRTGVLGSYGDDIDNALTRLDAPSAARLARDLDQRVSGVSLDVSAYLDRRDEPWLSAKGVLLEAGAEGFLDTEGSGYDYLQFHTGAIAFLPLGDVTFVLRGFALHTEPLGDPLPLLLLPRLSQRLAVGPGTGRFAGNDILLFDVQAQHPVPNLYEKYATDLFAVLGAYNVYDNLFTDARLAPSWAKKFAPADRYPLRAAFGVGIRAYDPQKRNAVLTGTIGVSADGFTLSSITFTLDPHRLRTPWRW